MASVLSDVEGTLAAAFSSGDANGVCVLHLSSPVHLWELRALRNPPLCLVEMV